MSRYEWERGTITLPTAEFAPFRKALQDADTRIKQAAFELTQAFWKGLTRKQQTDPVAYEEALRTWAGKRYNASISQRQHSSVLDLAYDKLYRPRYAGAGKPARVLKSAMDFPTNRTTQFVTSELFIGFNKAEHTVTWSVGENNHAVDNARESALGEAFMTQMNKVRWTRGTGGTLIGNDEYNRQADYSGGGANYVTAAWGWLGAAEAPESCKPWTDPKGQVYKVETKWSNKYGRLTGKVVKTTAADAFGRRSGLSGSYSLGYGGLVGGGYRY